MHSGEGDKYDGVCEAEFGALKTRTHQCKSA